MIEVMLQKNGAELREGVRQIVHNWWRLPEPVSESPRPKRLVGAKGSGKRRVVNVAIGLVMPASIQ